MHGFTALRWAAERPSLRHRVRRPHLGLPSSGKWQGRSFLRRQHLASPCRFSLGSRRKV